MKKLAYLLLAGGFLAGAFATALDEQNVDWLFFGIAAAVALAGVVLSKRLDSAAARSGELLEANRSELAESIGNLARNLEAMATDPAAAGERLRHRIDAELRPDLRRFAEARESMVHLYGLQTYADIMSEFAAGERYVNRVWSASADGYESEARDYIGRAAKQFGAARAQLQEAAGG